MEISAKILIGLVAVLHLYILWMEMFAWTTVGRKVFGKGRTKEFFESTKAMAANQGLYNGFLAAGLIWSLLITNSEWSFNVANFFLGCVIVAASFGAISVDKSIFVKQGIPAVLALLVLWGSTMFGN